MSTVTHRLKTHPAPYEAVRRGDKRFEVRWNDRLFQTGDLVELHYFDPNPSDDYTEVERAALFPVMTFRVGWILAAVGPFGIEAGYVAFTLKDPLDCEAKPTVALHMFEKLYTASRALTERFRDNPRSLPAANNHALNLLENCVKEISASMRGETRSGVPK